MTVILNSREFGSTSEGQVRALEEELGVSLPSDYQSFLLEHNGGIPSPENFVVPGLGDERTVETFFGLHDGPSRVSLRHHMREWKQLLPDCLPIGYEQGGNPICLRLRGENQGEVNLWDIYADEMTGETDPVTFYRLGRSFREFLEKLR
jgi:cell wall assembly regulator SMI1